MPTQWSETEVLREERLTYGELSERISRVRSGLAKAGIVEGDRVVVMFGVRADLYVLVLAMLASGIAVVFIDAGMGKKRVLQALKMARPKAIVSVDDVLKHRLWLRALWGLKRYSVDRARLGVRAFEELVDNEPTSEPVLERALRSPALITFTSGTTGKPKGANRTHDLLIAQHFALAEHFPAADGEVDMPCFPVVPLHNLCSGITTVMPAVDFRKPSSVGPAAVVSQILSHRVTRFSGAPAYMTRIADYLVETGIRLETVQSVGCGGAPTPRDLCGKLIEVFPDAEKLIIYGSTEAEPIASATMDDFLQSDGEGYLVGYVAESAKVALVDLPSPVPVLDAREMALFEVPRGDVGELVVRGLHVLRGYVDDREADRETKIVAPDGEVWHRTGDLARYDEEGRLWLLGRMSDVLEIEGRRVHPFPIEARLDGLQGVERSAFVALSPTGSIAVVVVVKDGCDELPVLEGVRAFLSTQGHPDVRAEAIAEIPVDARHNSKIDRPALRAALTARREVA